MNLGIVNEKVTVFAACGHAVTVDVTYRGEREIQGICAGLEEKDCSACWSKRMKARGILTPRED